MTVAQFESKLAKYRRKGLLLDTNLLLLYFTGLVGPEFIETFKPTRNHGFKLADFELLTSIVDDFRVVVTTLHVLSEVSNHADRFKGDRHAAMCRIMAASIGVWTEEFQPAVELCGREEFRKFGLTDSAISATAHRKYLVMTVDFALAGHLTAAGVDVVNFNHLRPLAWTQ